ncbi:GNAT family N-acetyltransferase [Actinoplanes sichuanensis]|uniref:GNAT family N-acetyltransferase n=2 Tax=Actinoplanes sichuanensis TaxID=512349 RepID=A0ABW4AY45_9ACTN|nr:GNAT family N-acetyltransferase [Actinoplanes sichuanensis]
MNSLHVNHQTFWRHMARGTGGSVHETVDGLRIFTGVVAAPFNQIHCHGTDDAAAIDQAASYFGDRRMPWRIVCAAPSPSAHRYAEQHGVSQEPLYPIMALDLTTAAPTLPCPAELTVTAAVSIEDVREFIDCAGAAFGHDPELIEAMCRPQTLADDDFRLYLGRVDGRCVAISVGVGVREHGTIGAYFVGVRPEARGRGYGRAVTERALADGATWGARTAVLQATPAGYPVYLKMGFAQVGDYHLWDFAPAESSQRIDSSSR